MPRWEFHLSMDEADTSARWTWMYRPDGGDTTVSKDTFATYRACIADALLHGYPAGDIPRSRNPAFIATG